MTLEIKIRRLPETSTTSQIQLITSRRPANSVLHADILLRGSTHCGSHLLREQCAMSLTEFAANDDGGDVVTLSGGATPFEKIGAETGSGKSAGKHSARVGTACGLTDPAGR